MASFSDAFKKIEANRDLCFDLLRIYLGVGLFVKGILFLTDMAGLTELLMKSGHFQPFTFLPTCSTTPRFSCPRMRNSSPSGGLP